MLIFKYNLYLLIYNIILISVIKLLDIKNVNNINFSSLNLDCIHSLATNDDRITFWGKIFVKSEIFEGESYKHLLISQIIINYTFCIYYSC